MNRIALFGVLVFFIASIAPPSWAGVIYDTPIPHQLVVRVAGYFDPNQALADIQMRWPGAVVASSVPNRKIYLLTLDPSVSESEVLAEIQQDLVSPHPDAVDPAYPLVWAELNFSAQLGEGRTGTIYVKTPREQGRDKMTTQYALPLMGVPAAQTRANGQATLVAVLDTGVDAQHEALAQDVLPGINMIDGSSDTSDVGTGEDTDGDGLVDEMVGHGTFVSGLIVLMAPDCRILPVKVLDSNGIGTLYNIASGMFFAIDRGCKVINMSLSSTSDSSMVRDACSEAALWGIPVVAAAGNQGHSAPPEYPAFGTNVIGVGATDDTDHLAEFSNFGQGLIVFAPGASAYDPNTGDIDYDRSIIGPLPGGDYGVWQGTSMSTAFVSGAVALFNSQHPEWPATMKKFSNFVSGIAGTCFDLEPLNPGYESQLGNGRLAIGPLAQLGPAQLMLGDLSGDQRIDWTDLAVVLSATGLTHSSADLNCNGVVDITDLATVLTYYGTSNDP